MKSIEKKNWAKSGIFIACALALFSAKKTERHADFPDSFRGLAGQSMSAPVVHVSEIRTLSSKKKSRNRAPGL